VVRLGESCTQQQAGINQTKSPSKPKRTSSSRFLNESKPGVFTSTKAMLDKDKDMVKKILKGVQLRRPVEVQSALLRRYFLELTQVPTLIGSLIKPFHVDSDQKVSLTGSLAMELQTCYNYLCTCCLYGAGRCDLDAGNILNEGCYKGWALKIETFWTLNGYERSECHFGSKKLNPNLPDK